MATKKVTTTKSKKVSAKKTATKKATTKKATTKKATAKKPVTKKKTATKKPVTKKATTKKATTKKASTKAKTTTKAKASTKKKAVVKPAVKRAGPKFPRGYKVKLVVKEFNLPEGKDMYEVYEVTGPKVDKTRFFVDEESVKLFIEKCEKENIEAKALAGKGYQFVPGVMKETKELAAAAELPELNCETPEDRYVAKNVEDTDK